MTDIDQAVVENVAKAYCDWFTGRNQGVNTLALAAALQAINLPDLLRKEREYDALLARVEAAPVGRVPFLKPDIAPGHVEVWFSIPVDVTLVSGKCFRLLEEPSNG